MNRPCNKQPSFLSVCIRAKLSFLFHLQHQTQSDAPPPTFLLFLLLLLLVVFLVLNVKIGMATRANRKESERQIKEKKKKCSHPFIKFRWKRQSIGRCRAPVPVTGNGALGGAVTSQATTVSHSSLNYNLITKAETHLVTGEWKWPPRN